MTYKKIREKRQRMSVVVLNSEHKVMTSWFKQVNTNWQQWLHSAVATKCSEIASQKETAKQLKLIETQAKQLMENT